MADKPRTAPANPRSPPSLTQVLAGKPGRNEINASKAPDLPHVAGQGNARETALQDATSSRIYFAKNSGAVPCLV